MKTKHYIEYGKEEIEYLTKKDPVLGNYIAEVGFLKREVNEDVYSSLIESIIGQQISTKAANTIRKRVLTLVGDITPTNIKKANQEDLLACGLSMRKYEYIIGITNAFLEDVELYENLNLKSNEEIIEILTKLRGIGIWTVEMLLIHTFLRKDIISFSDLAIKRGLMKLHDLDKLTKEDKSYYKNLYSPYATVASIYLWEKSKEPVKQ